MKGVEKMKKVIFRYGAMGAAKSANALMTAYNFEEQGLAVVLIKSGVDTRWSVSHIVSRAGGMARQCRVLPPDMPVFKVIPNDEHIDVIIVDEAQFLTAEQVVELVRIADQRDLLVICYGLKNSAIKGELFEGSRALLYWADTIEELKTVCSCCARKATMNLRLKNGIPIYNGDVVVLGDTYEKEGAEYYVPVCREHYFNPDLNKIREKAEEKEKKIQ